MIQFLRHLFGSQRASAPLKGKISAIKKDIIKLINNVCKEKFNVIWYGSYDIDPKNLVFWVCIKSDLVKKELQANKRLMEDLRALLEIHDYPFHARLHVHIGFESEETVDRESEGNWYYHFK